MFPKVRVAKLKRNWILGLVALALIPALGPVFKIGRAPVPSSAPAQGKPWNGGKPTAPMQVVSNIEGEIAPEEWVEVELSLLPLAPCQGLSSVLRGVDGIEVSDDSRYSHANCNAGEPIVRQVRVKAPQGVSGLVAIDLAFEGLDGTAYEVTRSIAFRAQGAPVLMDSNQEPN